MMGSAECADVSEVLRWGDRARIQVEGSFEVYQVVQFDGRDKIR
jgi:hypothetical protein